MPDLNHLWQRFLLASSLVVGLLLGAAVTVFGYSNLGSVNVRWSVIHIDGVPLWTVAVVPLALFLIAGTIYHWMDGLHHFSEHMRHRRRVHELEAEVASLRAHLDQVLDMPDHSTSKLPAKKVVAVSLPAADKEMAAVHADVADVEPAKPTPAAVEPAVKADAPAKALVAAADGRPAEKTSPTRKGARSGLRRRATLAAATERSKTQTISVDGTPAEPAMTPAKEA